MDLSQSPGSWIRKSVVGWFALKYQSTGDNCVAVEQDLEMPFANVSPRCCQEYLESIIAMGKTLAVAEHKEERPIVQAHRAGEQDNVRGSAESLPSLPGGLMRVL